MAVFGFWSINFIAAEIEMPFGDDNNDLPIAELQQEMNRDLKVLLCEESQHPPSFTFDPVMHEVLAEFPCNLAFSSATRGFEWSDPSCDFEANVKGKRRGNMRPTMKQRVDNNQKVQKETTRKSMAARKSMAVVPRNPQPGSRSSKFPADTAEPKDGTGPRECAQVQFDPPAPEATDEKGVEISVTQDGDLSTAQPDKPIDAVTERREAQTKEDIAKQESFVAAMERVSAAGTRANGSALQPSQLDELGPRAYTWPTGPQVPYDGGPLDSACIAAVCHEVVNHVKVKQAR